MRTLLEQAIGFLLLGAAAWYWLGIAESNAWTFLVSVLIFLVLLAGLVLLTRRGVRQSTVTRPIAWLLGIPVAWLLVKWVPEFSTFTMQAASMIVRFLCAYLLFLMAWVTILSLAGARRKTAAA